MDYYKPHRDLRIPMADAACDGIMRIVDRGNGLAMIACDICDFTAAILLRELA